jgi:hypothetical protein
MRKHNRSRAKGSQEESLKDEGQAEGAEFRLARRHAITTTKPPRVTPSLLSQPFSLDRFKHLVSWQFLHT